MASYYVYSGAAGSANGTSWANAYTTLSAAFSGHAAGDTYYVAHDHVEAPAGTNITLSSNGTVVAPTKAVCVNRAGSVPPVSADRRATAAISTTTFGQLEFNGFTHYDGIIFSCGSGNNGIHLVVPSSSQTHIRFDNCSLRLITTAVNSQLRMASGGTFLELNNTTLQFSNASQHVRLAGVVKWRNTPSALLGTIPATLFQESQGSGGEVECIGVDLSAIGSGKTIASALSTSQTVKYRFIDCKLDAAVTKATLPGAAGAVEFDFIRSGATGVNYAAYRARVSGQLTEETTIVRTGGANDGTTTIAWKIVTTANCTYSMPFETPPIAIWCDTIGSVTATVECIAASIMTDLECWLDVEYLGDASSPQGSFVNDGTLDLLTTPANQTSSSATWGGSTTAFKLAVTFTTAQKGWIYARVKIGKASSTVYVDPLITLT